MRNVKQEFSCTDLYLASYLALQGLPFELHVNNNLVTFNFAVSDLLYGFIEKFNSDEVIPVFGYSQMIKQMRGRMLSKKTGGQQR